MFNAHLRLLKYGVSILRFVSGMVGREGSFLNEKSMIFWQDVGRERFWPNSVNTYTAGDHAPFELFNIFFFMKTCPMNTKSSIIY